MTISTLDRVNELVGAAELVELLGLSRQRVHQLVTRDDFPAPVVTLAMGKVWSRDDVVAWAKATGREVADDA